MRRPTSREPVKEIKRVLGCIDQRLTHHLGVAGQESEHARGQARLLQDLHQLVADHRRLLGRLEDDAVAARDGGGDHAGGDGQREVPGRDAQADAQGDIVELVVLAGQRRERAVRLSSSMAWRP